MRSSLLVLVATCSVLHAQDDPFRSLDANGDGKLSLAEIPEQLKSVFPLADADGDHFVSAAEFQKFAARQTGPSPKGGADLELLKDIDYVGKGNPRQKLDLLVHKDRSTKKRPLVVFVHGGGWMEGRKEDGKPIINGIAGTGDYVAATINYRLSDEAIWPAQIFDCKAAIRFLRAKADDYGIDPARIGVMGASAGGQLVCMLGTCHEASLEGSLGEFPKVDSRVQCVVNFFGPTDFLTFFGKDVPIESLRSKNVAMRFLGEKDEQIRENARSASPVTWISKDDAPFLTAHGTKDSIVPYAQAQELDAALRKSGVETHLIAMEGADHGFANADLNERIRLFLNLHLKGQPAEISSAPIQVK